MSHAGAIAGDIGLLTGTIPASREWLQGSPFVDYTIPALSLMVLVGSGMPFAKAPILGGRECGVPASALARLMMMGFLVVEAAVIDRVGGSELLLAVGVQDFYLALGLAICVSLLTLGESNPVCMLTSSSSTSDTDEISLKTSWRRQRVREHDGVFHRRMLLLE